MRPKYLGLIMSLVLMGCQSESPDVVTQTSVQDAAEAAVKAAEANAANIYSAGSGSSNASETTDERLARARGITKDEMLDPAHGFGYTEEDKAFLDEHGVSASEARAAERVLCGAGVDC